MRIMNHAGPIFNDECGFEACLLQNAYGLKMPDMLSGLPGWADSAKFDVEAKMDAETIAALKAMPKEQADEQRRQMMQAMLADRFKLKVHRETKELPIYSLVIAKGGFKLKDADPNSTYPDGIKGTRRRLPSGHDDDGPWQADWASDRDLGPGGFPVATGAPAGGGQHRAYGEVRRYAAVDAGRYVGWARRCCGTRRTRAPRFIRHCRSSWG